MNEFKFAADTLNAAAPPGEPQVDFESPDVAVAENKGG